MISIKRDKCPDVLKGSPKTGTLYNRKNVVKTLWKMQHKKCCYCEAEIPEEGHLKAVEHFYPKSVYKGKRNDWKNLLLVCAQCNGKKSDKFPTMLTTNEDEPNVIYLGKTNKTVPLLIDPSNENIEPEDHITFIVDEIHEEDYGLPRERNNSKYGRFTIDVVGLDGLYYCRKRRSWHRILVSVYLNLLEAKDLEDQEKLQSSCEKFELYMSVRKELAAYTREFARQKKLSEYFPITIPKGY